MTRSDHLLHLLLFIASEVAADSRELPSRLLLAVTGPSFSNADLVFNPWDEVVSTGHLSIRLPNTASQSADVSIALNNLKRPIR